LYLVTVGIERGIKFESVGVFEDKVTQKNRLLNFYSAFFQKELCKAG